MSQRVRKRVEEIFGWMKTVGSGDEIRSVAAAFVDEEELLQEIGFGMLVRVEAVEKTREACDELRRAAVRCEIYETRQSLAHLYLFGSERRHPSKQPGLASREYGKGVVRLFHFEVKGQLELKVIDEPLQLRFL